MPGKIIPPGIEHHALTLWTIHGFNPSLAWLWEQGYKVSDDHWSMRIKKRDKTVFPRPSITRTTWTPNDLAYLKTHYQTATKEELVQRLNRSYQTIRSKAHSLGIRREDFHRRSVPSQTIEVPTLWTQDKRPDLRFTRLVDAWGGDVRYLETTTIVNSQWCLIPITTPTQHKLGSLLDKWVKRTVMNVALFNPAAPYLTSMRGRHYACYTPHALVLVPGPDRVVRGWNLEPQMDLEAMARIYGPATRLSKKRSIHRPKPGPGRPKKDSYP